MKKKVLIIGSGVVGQASGKGFARISHEVTFHDIRPEVLQKLEGEGYHTGSDYNLKDFDLSIVSVSTPTRDNHIVLDYLQCALRKLAAKLVNTDSYHLVVIRCTLPPGITEEWIIPLLEHYSLKRAGVDFGICVNPEFLREASSEEDFARPWLIVVGAEEPRVVSIMKELYQPLKCEVKVCRIKEAEMMKYVHNLYNATKISFFNEMHNVCLKLGIDSTTVNSLVVKSAEGLWNPAYGTKGGPPYGGSCLPKDTRAFRSFAWEQDLGPMTLLDATIKVNEQMGESREEQAEVEQCRKLWQQQTQEKLQTLIARR
jgi:UDPglucose 6-dehydrogenase